LTILPAGSALPVLSVLAVLAVFACFVRVKAILIEIYSDADGKSVL
jgi:hypothetical protein